MLADTTFLIDVMMGESKAVVMAKSLSEASVPLLVGAPSVFELYVGVGLSSKSSEEKRKVEEALEFLTQLSLDQGAVRRAGTIYAQKSKEGKKIEPEDAMIAGIAVENGQPVLTRNIKDFSGIPDLKVETY
jgi:predicted nucleic acid-binding protein